MRVSPTLHGLVSAVAGRFKGTESPSQHSPVLASAVGRTANLDGRDHLLFASTNYLGLSGQPLSRVAGAWASLCHGSSVSASRSTTGTHVLHTRLERALAWYMGAEDVCLIGSGGLANRAAIEALTVPGGPVFFEASSHSSLLAAVPTDRELFRFSMDDLDNFAYSVSYQPGALVLLDGVSAKTGQVAAIQSLLDCLPEELGARVLVDDCHGVFVLGRRGRGSLEHCGINSPHVYQTATMSKGLGTYGGFVPGSREFCKKLRETPAYIGSTALPPTVVAASLANLLIVMTRGSVLRRMAQDHARALARCLSDLGFQVHPSDTPILMLEPPSGVDSQWLADQLKQKGIHVSLIRYPYKDSPPVLRVVVSAAHYPQDIDRLVAAVQETL